MAKASAKKGRETAVESRGAEKGRGGVQSIARAFSILEEVARHRDGINLADLSKQVGLHNSTTFHLAKTMVQLGYIRQLSDSKRYRVGRPLFTLAAASLDDVEIVSLATPVLEDLSKATGECSHLAVRSGNEVTILARTAGSGAFQMTDRAGVVRPAHCTALGKILLAALTEDQFDRFLQDAKLEAFTAKSIVDPGQLRREIEEVRRGGVAIDDGEFSPEARCVAMAVRNFTGQVAGAIGISAPAWRLSIQSLRERTEQVCRAAERLSADLGYRGDVGEAAPARDTAGRKK